MKTPSLFSAPLTRLCEFIEARGWRQAWARGDLGDTGAGSRLALHQAAQNSVWVFRCLQLISGPVRSMPLKWFTSGRDGKVELQDPELANFWEMPGETNNGRLGFGDFTELSLNWINLKGQAFYVLDDSWLVRGGVKSPVLLARADRLSPMMRGDTLLGWTFTDGAARSTALLPQQVLRPRFLNPYDDAGALSPLEAAQLAIEADHASATFARNVAESNGDQGVYVIAKNATLSAEQQAQIIAQLRQKSAQSKAGNFRPAFLTGDVSIEDPKVKTVDGTFVGARAASQAEIFVAFGVPPSMAKESASYSVGAASDWFRLIIDTCMPHSQRLCEVFERIEFMRTGRMLKCEQDFSAHPVMAQARLDRVKTAVEMWRAGVPWDVINATLELGLPAFNGSDAAWLPMSLDRVSDAAPSSSPAEKSARLPAADPLAELKALFEKAPLQTPCTDPKCTAPHAHKAKGSERRVKLWQARMNERAPVLKMFEKKINAALFAARKETLAKIEASEKSLVARQRGILDILFDLGGFVSQLWVDMQAAHQFTLNLGLEQIAEELGREDPWQMPPEKTLNFLRQRENRIRDAARSVHEDIKTTLQEGLNKGETAKELADRVRAAFNGIEKDRAESIALTEVGAAYGLSRHESLNAFGIEKREWLSAQDDRVRDTHRQIDGSTAAMDEPFNVPLKDGGSEPMMHPGDSAGSAENVIRCRCVEIAALDED